MKNVNSITGELAHKRGVEAGTIDATTGLLVKPESTGQPNAEGGV